jgi:hypothetical protein
MDLTTSLSTVTLPTVSHKIQKHELKAGDVLCNCGPGTGGDARHVLIFEKWANPQQNTYWAYEERGPDGSPAEHHIVHYRYGNDQRFLPFRYNNFQ